MRHKGFERGIGDGVHGVPAYQAIHIERVGIGGIFYAGGGPQQGNPVRALLCKRCKFRAAEIFLPVAVGSFGERNGGFALQVFRQRGIQCAVYARDEKTGDYLDLGYVCARCRPLGDARNIGLIGFERLRARKQQGEINVNAFGNEFGQRGQALISGGDFYHGVWTADGCPQAAGLSNRARAVAAEFGRYFQADEACFAAAAVEFGAAHVAGSLNIGHCQRFVDFLGCFTLFFQGFYFGRVKRVACKGFLENGGIGGYAAHALFQHLRQRAVLHEAARQIVQPNLLSELFHLREDRHGFSLFRRLQKRAMLTLFGAIG